MRCLTLADALREKGKASQFICRELPGHMIKIIEKRGYPVLSLSTQTDKFLGKGPYENWLAVSWREDADACQKILQTCDAHTVITDHYALDSKWEMAAIPPQKTTVVIDDLANRPHHCDILLDQNLGRKAVDYDGLVPDKCVRYTGPKFALLRPGFSRENCSVALHRNTHIKHILVAIGGVDKDNITGEILRTISECDLPVGTHITVVLGDTAPAISKLKVQALQMPFPTEILVNVADMARLMKSADIAIGAAGSSAWERCSLGLPTLLLVLADNQLPAAQALSKVGAVQYLGDVRDGSWQKELRFALSNVQEKGRLEKMSQQARSLECGTQNYRFVDQLIARCL